jgi:hypothetical protein
VLPLRVFADGFFDVSHSVVFLQPDVLAFQIASLVDLADRGKPTLSGIVKVWLFFVFVLRPSKFRIYCIDTFWTLLRSLVCAFGGFGIVVNVLL